MQVQLLVTITLIKLCSKWTSPKNLKVPINRPLMQLLTNCVLTLFSLSRNQLQIHNSNYSSKQKLNNHHLRDILKRCQINNHCCNHHFLRNKILLSLRKTAYLISIPRVIMLVANLYNIIVPQKHNNNNIHQKVN